MSLAPVPQYPERGVNFYERRMAPNIAGNRGPLRFEEGVATDTDVPNDFSRGAYFDTASAPGRPSHNNPEGVFKRAEETMRERAHAGMASWIDSPTVLGEFAEGSMNGYGPPTFLAVQNPGVRMARPAASRVTD